MINSPIAQDVLGHLRANHFNDLADQLQSFLDLMTSTDTGEVLDAANRVQGLCRARVLGDLKIETIGGNDWLKLLSRLSKYAAKVARKQKSAT